MDNAFKTFVQENSFKGTIEYFEKLRKHVLNISKGHLGIYKALQGKCGAQEAKNLFNLLDKKIRHQVYDGQPCKGKRVLILGAGPCGLRMAIECALLGAEVIVVESREYMSRNNVLHLWPFVIHDIKSLGGKVFFPKFCTGSVEHISIRRLQLILLKISLLFNVQVHVPVSFKCLLEPNPQKGTGWRALVEPSNSSVGNVDYDFIVGATGKYNALPDFSKKCLRGKLAIAITANFVNRQTMEDAAIPETGGLSFIFDQPFFLGLKERTGIDLENYVYYKDETHYFVMTAKKQCLLKKGVLKRDFGDAKKLLHRDNIDRNKLKDFAYIVSQETTNHKLRNAEFAKNHYGQEDIAIFDFTAIHQAKNSCFARELHGKTLLQCLVGDCLLEPFWPVGTGCARGFLGVMDAAWLTRNWCVEKDIPKLNLIAERECIFQILSQTMPENLSRQFAKYSIDPATRYGMQIKTKTAKSPSLFKHLYVQEHLPKQPSVPVAMETDEPPVRRALTKRKRAHEGSLNPRQLLAWYQNQLSQFQDIVTINDLNESWRNGLALCAVIQKYLPGKLVVRNLNPKDVQYNLQKAFYIIEDCFDLSPVVAVDDLVSDRPVDKLGMLSYLIQLQEVLLKLDVADSSNLEISKRQKTVNFKPTLVGPSQTEQPPSLPVHPSIRGVLRSVTQKFASLEALRNVPVKRKMDDWVQIRTLQRHKTRKQTTLKRQKAVRKSQSDVSGQKQMARVAAAGDRKTNMSKETVNSSTDEVLQPKPSDHPPQASRRSVVSSEKLVAPPDPKLDFDDKVCKAQEPPKLVTTDRVDSRVVEEPRKRMSVGDIIKNMENANVNDTKAAQVVTNTCFVCHKNLFIVESTSAHGHFFHRQCFKCAVCGTQLRIASSVSRQEEDGQTIFLCTTHTFTPLVRAAGHSKKETQEEAGKTPSQTSPDEVQAPLVLDLREDDIVGEEAAEEEEEASSESDPEDDAYVSARSYIGLQQSMRLLEADEIQSYLDDVEDEKQELDKEGLELEKKIRQAEEIDESTMTDWVDVLERKRELVAFESKIELRLKLHELKERHQRLMLELEALEVEAAADDPTLGERVQLLDEDTQLVENSLEQIVLSLKTAGPDPVTDA